MANSGSFEFAFVRIKFVQCRISAPMSRLPRQFALTSDRGSTTRPRHTAIFIAAQLGYVQCSEIAIGRDVAVTIESRSDPSSSRCQIRARALKPRGLMAGAKDVFSANEQPGWWSQTGSNRRPPACKAGALPTELWPRLDLTATFQAISRDPATQDWWAWKDLNFRPHAYQARALTN